MIKRVILVLLCVVASAGLVLGLIDFNDPSWRVRLADILLCCGGVAVAAFFAAGPKLGAGEAVAPSGVWMTPETPLNVGDKLLAPDIGRWWRAEVVALNADGTVTVRPVGCPAARALAFKREQLQIEPSGQPSPPQKKKLGAAGWIIAPFFALAALGMILSLVTHLNAILAQVQPLGAVTWGLHMGIFVVVIAAIVAGKTRGAPLSVGWGERLTSAFFVYAIINFLTFMGMMFLVGGAREKGEAPDPLVFRGFSGHWMLFYWLAMTMLFSTMLGRTIPPVKTPAQLQGAQPPVPVPAASGGSSGQASA